VVICLQRGADLHMAQLMPLPLTVSCFSKIQIGFTFLVLAHPSSPGQRAIKRLCVCVPLPTYADNVALPAFARRCCSNQSICSPGQACGSGFDAVGQTDGQTDTHTAT